MPHLAEDLFGVETEDAQPDSPQTIGTTVSRVLDKDPDRVQLVFTNPGGTNVWLNTTGSFSAQEGFVVPSGQGSLILNVVQDGSLPQREWYAVVGSGTQDLNIQAEKARGEVTPGAEVSS